MLLLEFRWCICLHSAPAPTHRLTYIVSLPSVCFTWVHLFLTPPRNPASPPVWQWMRSVTLKLAVVGILQVKGGYYFSLIQIHDNLALTLLHCSMQLSVLKMDAFFTLIFTRLFSDAVFVHVSVFLQNITFQIFKISKYHSYKGEAISHIHVFTFWFKTFVSGHGID